jgi:hypothetical protein
MEENVKQNAVKNYFFKSSRSNSYRASADLLAQIQEIQT